MELMLSDSKNHALLAKVISMIHEEGRACGRTLAQKILFFLKVYGVPMKYNFKVHHYGPYCSEISNDLRYLEIDHVIKDQSEDERWSKFVPDEGTQILTQRYSEYLQAHEGQIQRLVSILAPMQLSDLEKVSTLYYAYLWERAKGMQDDLKTRTLNRFREYKKEAIESGRIDMEEIDRLYDQLIQNEQ